MQTSPDVVEVYQPGLRRKFFLGPQVTVVPPLESGVELYARRVGPDNAVDYVRIGTEFSRHEEEQRTDAVFVRLRLQHWTSLLALPLIVNDVSGQLDLILQLRWRVSEPMLFLRSYCSSGCERVSPSEIERAIKIKIRPHAELAATECRLSQLVKDNPLPASWWESRMKEWLHGTGIGAEVVDISWQGADVRRQQAEEEESRRESELEAGRKRKFELELREQKEKAEHQNRISEIENDARLSEIGREQQKAEQRIRNQIALLKLEKEKQAVELDMRRAATEQELHLARIKEDQEAQQTAKRKQDEAVLRFQDITDSLKKTQDALERLSHRDDALRLFAEMMKEGFASRPKADRLVHEYGFPAEVLPMPVVPTGDGFASFLRNEVLSSPVPVDVRKIELRTRDIGTRKALTLPIGSSLQFEFTSPIPGYATVLNVGTSGSVYLHVPNAYTAVERTRITAKRRYQIPGAELLPDQELRRNGLDYWENGPPGWEHLAVIVSEQPLLEGRVLHNSSAADPIVKLTASDLVAIHDRLRGQTDKYCVGLLSFLVRAE